MFTYIIWGYCILGAIYAIRTCLQYKHLVFYEIPIIGFMGFALWPMLAWVDALFLLGDLKNKSIKRDSFKL